MDGWEIMIPLAVICILWMLVPKDSRDDDPPDDGSPA